jgi:hypothetical protein
MEQITLNDLSRQIYELRREMIEIKEILLETGDEDLVGLQEEIEESKKGKSNPHSEVVKRFCS